MYKKIRNKEIKGIYIRINTCIIICIFVYRYTFEVPKPSYKTERVAIFLSYHSYGNEGKLTPCLLNDWRVTLLHQPIICLLTTDNILQPLTGAFSHCIGINVVVQFVENKCVSNQFVVYSLNFANSIYNVDIFRGKYNNSDLYYLLVNNSRYLKQYYDSFKYFSTKIRLILIVRLLGDIPHNFEENLKII